MKVSKKKPTKSEKTSENLKPTPGSADGVYQVKGTMMSNIQVSRPPFSNYKFGSLL